MIINLLRFYSAGRLILVLSCLFMLLATINVDAQKISNSWGRGRDQPNIVFIMTDDLGIRDLGCYGSDYYHTPHLDAFAEEGMVFTRAYSAAAVCSPTRAATLTGRTPQRLHLTDALPWDRLPENPKLVPPEHLKELPTSYVTYAKALRTAGYRTSLIGKWHLGNEYVFYNEGGHEAYGFDEAFDADYKFINKVDKAVDVLTRKALDFLERNKDRPFMLSLNHHTPHVPLACPPEYIARYDGLAKGEFQKNQKYAGMMSHLDDSVQRVLDKLKSLGLEQNTIVIFTSDNGGQSTQTSNLPFRGGKATLNEGGLRVPLIIRWPGAVDAGSTCAVPVSSVDWFPTFLDMAGLDLQPEAHKDGWSMLALLKQEGTFPERNLFWHKPHYHSVPESSMISGEWKLIHDIESNSYELYNLELDPFESRDLASLYPEKTSHLEQLLGQYLDASGAQRMRPNRAWSASQARGGIRNFGVFYPKGGGTYRQDQGLAYPDWFDLAEDAGQ
ncbi:sulfatase [Coraliomargarita sp. W4R72]